MNISFTVTASHINKAKAASELGLDAHPAMFALADNGCRQITMDKDGFLFKRGGTSIG